MKKYLLYSGAIIIGLLFFLSLSSVSSQSDAFPTVGLTAPSSAAVNQPVNITVTGMDDIDVRWIWVIGWGDGPATNNYECTGVQTACSPMPPFSHTYTLPGTYTILVRVFDSSNQSTDKTSSITITSTGTDNPPVITELSGLSSIQVGGAITLIVTGQDDRDIAWLYITYGDGSPPETFTCLGTQTTCSNPFTHYYQSAGSYTVRAQVTDSPLYQDSGFTTKPITVTEAAPGPGPGPGECEPCPPNSICNPLNVCSFEDLINTITNFIFWVALALAPLLILIAGFYILTAGGDPNRVTTGKRIMIYTIIGFAIILFARGLIALLKNVLGVQ